MVQAPSEKDIRALLALFLVPAGLAGPRLEPFLAPLAPPLDFALSFCRHRHLLLEDPEQFCLKSRNCRTTSDLKRRRAQAQTADTMPHRRKESM